MKDDNVKAIYGNPPIDDDIELFMQGYKEQQQSQLEDYIRHRLPGIRVLVSDNCVHFKDDGKYTKEQVDKVLAELKQSLL